MYARAAAAVEQLFSGGIPRGQNGDMFWVETYRVKADKGKIKPKGCADS